MAERRLNQNLRGVYFYTGNFALYCVEDGEAVVYFGGRENNPLFQNMDSACVQLAGKGDYVPPAADVGPAKGSAKRFVLDDLGLEGSESEWRYFAVRPTDYDLLNAQQRDFAEGVYGSGEAFKGAMNTLADAGNSETRVFLLSPSYVHEHASEDAIVRACWLLSFDYNSYFGANAHDVNGSGALRGVRR
jgi:hypothetical protein